MNPDLFTVVTSSGAGIFAAVVIIAGILGCGIFLYVQSSATVKVNKDGAPVETMGHVWDETLQEYNNPMPGWWRNLFYLTIIFGLAYVVLYPTIAVYAGAYNWTQANQLAAEAAEQEKKLTNLKGWGTMPIEELAKDKNAMNSAQKLFLNSCARCHASDAGGNSNLGYPNLRDKDWLWGGTGEDIKKTLTEGRLGVMPEHMSSLGQGGVKAVANYVLSMSNRKHDAGLAAEGKKTYDSVCFACHGADGKGNHALGAPNLTDDIWLHGNSFTQIEDTIARGRQNQMPAHANILGPDRINLLAAYVWQLGGGVVATPATPAEPVAAVAQPAQ